MSREPLVLIALATLALGLSAVSYYTYACVPAGFCAQNWLENLAA